MLRSCGARNDDDDVMEEYKMKELLFRTLRHEETERAPWVPFAGVHAG